MFDGDAIQRRKVMFEKVCSDFEAPLVEMNGQAEHVHLLITYPPKHSVSSMVNSLKGVSSRLLGIGTTRHRETLLERCSVVAKLLRCQLWRRTARQH